MWWTLEIGDQIGRIEPGGAMVMFTIPNVQVLPWDITAGLDGRLWFTELAGRAIGRISTSGASLQEIPVPGAFSGIAGVAPGPDGRLYFTENDTHRIGVMRKEVADATLVLVGNDRAGRVEHPGAGLQGRPERFVQPGLLLRVWRDLGGAGQPRAVRGAGQ